MIAPARRQEHDQAREVSMAGQWGYFGSPEVVAKLLRQFGGPEGLAQAMREACPLCAAGEQHKH